MLEWKRRIENGCHQDVYAIVFLILKYIDILFFTILCIHISVYMCVYKTYVYSYVYSYILTQFFILTWFTLSFHIFTNATFILMLFLFPPQNNSVIPSTYFSSFIKTSSIQIKCILFSVNSQPVKIITKFQGSYLRSKELKQVYLVY